MLAFSLVSVLFLYLIQRMQHWLPFSNGMVNVNPVTAFNTAASFTTNTNWQNYSGESTMGYVTQMAGLAVQNFVSAGVGIVVVIALIRGFMRSRTDRLGNFWVDLTRVTFRLLLPFSVVGAIILMATGVIDNFGATHVIHTLAGGTQTMVGGPVASQEVIKELGNNGGGFFNANSSHPFENPNPFSDWFEIFLLLVIPFALPRTFGKMVGDNRQGYVLVAVMAGLWLVAVGGITFFEWQHAGTAPQAARGAMEGKEVRFGIPGSSLFAGSTTVTSTGAVNSFHDSFTPFGGGIALFDMMLGEVVPGGVGAGLYGMLMLAVVTVFVAGLMVGRTPEYLGKKIRPVEMKWAAAYILATPGSALIGAALALGFKTPRSAILNPGPHGLTEVVYAFTSMANNNGSAFAGLATAATLYQAAGGIVMLVGPVRTDDLRPGPGRVAGPAAARTRERGHARHPQAPVRRHAGRRDHHPGRPDLLPGAGAGAVRRRTALMSLTRHPGADGTDRQPGTAREREDLQQPRRVGGGLLDPKMLWKSLPDAFKKLDPRVQLHNPVMFVVEVGAVLTTYSAIIHDSVFDWTITAWLWLTVLFANLAEAVAEGRGKAQAETLRRTKQETVARRLVGWQPGQADQREEEVPGTQLTLGDYVVVEPGQIIPGDGDVVEGVASVDESAITGESAPVIRESGGDRSAVTGGTRVLSDRIVVQDHLQAGRDVHRPDDRPGRGGVAAEDAERAGAEHPAGLADAHLHARRDHPAADGVLLQGAAEPGHPGRAARRADPDHDRRAAVRDRHRRHGPAGPAQRAGPVRPRGRGGGRREHAAAGQDRHDHHRQPRGQRVHPGHRRERRRSWPTRPSCPAWPTRRRRAARSWCWPRTSTACANAHEGELQGAEFVQFTAQTRMSGVDLADGRDEVRKGAASAVARMGPGQRRDAPGRTRPDRGRHLRGRRHAAGRGGEGRRHGPGPRGHLPQGHRQGGHRRAVRRDAQDGHPDRHDHR